MIDSLIGTIEGPSIHGMGIRCGSVVFEIRCTERNMSDWINLPEDTELRIWTNLQHIPQTGEFRLYGFSSNEEKLLFLALCTVRGIGPTTALGVLEAQEPLDVLRAASSGDAGFLATLPNIGPSRAHKLVAGLKEHIPSLPDPLPVPVGAWAESRALFIEDGLSFSEAEDRVSTACAQGAKTVKEIMSIDM